MATASVILAFGMGVQTESLIQAGFAWGEYKRASNLLEVVRQRALRETLVYSPSGSNKQVQRVGLGDLPEELHLRLLEVMRDVCLQYGKRMLQDRMDCHCEDTETRACKEVLKAGLDFESEEGRQVYEETKSWRAQICECQRDHRKELCTDKALQKLVAALLNSEGFTLAKPFALQSDFEYFETRYRPSYIVVPSWTREEDDGKQYQSSPEVLIKSDYNPYEYGEEDEDSEDEGNPAKLAMDASLLQHIVQSQVDQRMLRLAKQWVLDAYEEDTRFHVTLAPKPVPAAKSKRRKTVDDDDEERPAKPAEIRPRIMALVLPRSRH